MPTLNFETHEVEAIERNVSAANGNMPWKLDLMRSQITPRGSVIYSFSCELTDTVMVDAQSNLTESGYTSLYGIRLDGPGVMDMLVIKHEQHKALKELQAEEDKKHREAEAALLGERGPCPETNTDVEGEPNDNQ